MLRYVASRRAELGLDNTEVMVPQSHEPGAEAEVDFGEFHAVIAGALAKLWMFVMRLSCSGRAFHVAFVTGTGPSPSGSSPCAAITGSTHSSAPRARAAPMRRAGWKARVAGSAALTWCPSPQSVRWPR